MARFTAPLRLALSVGVVGGLVLGCREALLTLQANAFAQPGQYFYLYLTVPIVAWMLLGVAVLLPLAVAQGLRGAGSATRATLWPYAAFLAFAGTLSITVPWIAAIAAQLRDMGVSLRGSLAPALGVFGVLLPVAAACVVGAAAAWYAARVQRPLRYAARLATVAFVLLLWPAVRFLATDWKWGITVRDAAGAADGQPNVLLISIDTLRADHLGSYGDAHGLTPHMDRLAAAGVLFEHAITSSPWTLPAVASMLTGQDPHRHGAGAITNRRDPLGRSALSEGAWTLAQALHERGYRTHAIVTNPYLALRYGLGQGFDSYENVSIESEAFLAFGQTTAVRLLNWLRPDVATGDRGETVSARAQRWLEAREPARPFFLWLHYVDPHPPYSRASVTRHKSFRTDSLFAPAAGSEAEMTLTSPDVARLRSGEIRLSAEQKEAVHDLYRAEVASVDAAVGAVLDALDRVGGRERTLVVCVADHGEEFWEHGGVEHGHTVYEELVRVPWLLRWPGHLPEGARVQPVVRITDVAPTILDLLSIAPPPDRDGQSVLPVLRGDESRPRIAVSENLLFAEERTGLRTPAHKYVHWDSGKEEVYDLTTDPEERRDLAGIDATLGPLRQLYATIHRSRPAADGKPQPPQLDGGAEQALRALGYLR